MNFTDVFRSIQETGGASFNVNTGELNPPKGYMVPLSKNYERKFAIPQTFHDFGILFKAYMAEHWDHLMDSGYSTFIGFWIHDRNLYIDLAENIENPLEAYNMGIQRNQIAIYDCAKKEDIKIIYSV